MNTDTLEEMQLLLKFCESPKHLGTQSGIKVHSSASQSHKSAAKRLFNKGLISQKDGGYLTDRGIEAADHCQYLSVLLATC